MDKLISLNAAIDALDRIFDRCEEIEVHLPEGDPDRTGYKMYPDYMTVWKYLHQLPSAQPEPQWIPCSERLPEKEGWYITTVESEKTGKRRIENDLFAIDIALAHGHTPNNFCKDGHRQRTVAWCEFPEPWTGAGK